MKQYILSLLVFFMLVLVSSCKKDFLDKKPDMSLVVPITLNDMQLLLDNNLVMNTTPAISLISADDLYTTEAAWQSLSTAIQRNSYIWAADVYEGGVVSDWAAPYAQVFYANVVLKGLDKIQPSVANKTTYDKIKGSALFYRAYAFYQLAQLFAPAYVPANADKTPGIIIRLDPDVNLRPSRSTLAQTYSQVISDLQQAESLLPLQSQVKTQPSRWASYAMLARTYLTMQDYENSKIYATKSLEISNALLDYNLLNPAAPSPFPTLTSSSNKEIIYYSSLLNYNYMVLNTTMVNPDVYASYAENDLRRQLFCNNRGNGVVTFKGSYTGGIATFSGLSTDEVYLIRAECFARLKDGSKAMTDLNNLMKTRWKQGYYSDLAANTPDQALELIVLERRKQLFARGLRWTDLKRLNQEERFAVSITRRLYGTDYVLSPKSLRYTFPLPIDEINERVEQNPR